jgi:hypothetical protein
VNVKYINVVKDAQQDLHSYQSRIFILYLLFPLVLFASTIFALVHE